MNTTNQILMELVIGETQGLEKIEIAGRIRRLFDDLSLRDQVDILQGQVQSLQAELSMRARPTASYFLEGGHV